MLESLNCRVCGGNLELKEGGTYVCAHCGHAFARKAEDEYAEKLRDVLKEEKYERVSAARQNLWAAMHGDYINSDACVSYARELKNLVSSDYYANFAEAANSKNDADVSKFLNSSSAEDMEVYADAVLDFMICSMTSKNLMAVCNYIDRAFPKSSSEYARYINLYEKEAEKVSAGVYERSIERDVFLAYSSADTGKVWELCDYLESQGITCFLSIRNLRHGRGAADNYDAALREAMDNCRTVVFVSSKNSRDLSCDALRKELPYIRARDMEIARANGINLSYDKLEPKYKKPRVEYLLDDYTGSPADKMVKQFFDGVEWCDTPDAVALRVCKLITSVPETAVKTGNGKESTGSEEVRPENSSSVSLDVREKHVLEHTERLIGIGSFQDALNGLIELEKELIASRGKASAALYYYKILAKYSAKDFDEAVKNITYKRTFLSNDKDYLLAKSCDDEAYKTKLEKLAQKSEELITQQNTAEENERRRQEIARTAAEEEKRKLDEATTAKANKVYRSVVASFTLILVILFALMVTGLVIGYSGNDYFCNAFCGIVGTVAFAAFLVVLILNRIVLGDYRDSYFLDAYDSAPLGLRRFWMYGLLVVFALSFILGVFFMF